jgi:hypothetical protein
MTCMKTLPKMDISDELNAQINQSIKVSGLSKADVVRQALKLGLPQFAARFQPPSKPGQSMEENSRTMRLGGKTSMKKATRKKKSPADEFVASVGRALRRSARVARKTARMYGTPIYIWRDGKVVAVKP